VKVLVTGADGFVGRWLADHLVEQQDDIWLGVGRAADQSIGGAQSIGRARVVDVRDAAEVASLIEWARPDAIYHLAAIAFGPDARRSVHDAVDINVRGTTNVLEAARALDDPPTVFIPSSAEVYGAPEGQGRIDEAYPCRPVNAYGASKLAQEAVGLAYDFSGTVPVVIARAFNHIGPGQRDVFVISSFATQLANITRSRQPPVLHVGNLDAQRDFTDVRDVVRAYRLLVAGDHHGEPINVASGSPVSIREMLDRLIQLSGADVTVEVDPSRMRAVDPQTIVGDPGRLATLTGWQPAHLLDKTLADIWEDALERVEPA
jgi:GDP-4-dehydro-6-deoxy-D-mannose reductase